MLVFFLWVIWLWILITCFIDLFRRDDIGGWSKALWIVFLIVLPFLGVFIYVITQSGKMTERRVADYKASQDAFDAHIRNVAGSGGDTPADQIARAKDLLDQGAIDQTEYDVLKSRALA